MPGGMQLEDICLFFWNLFVPSNYVRKQTKLLHTYTAAHTLDGLLVLSPQHILDDSKHTTLRETNKLTSDVTVTESDCDGHTVTDVVHSTQHYGCSHTVHWRLETSHGHLPASLLIQRCPALTAAQATGLHSYSPNHADTAAPMATVAVGRPDTNTEHQTTTKAGLAPAGDRSAAMNSTQPVRYIYVQAIATTQEQEQRQGKKTTSLSSHFVNIHVWQLQPSQKNTACHTHDLQQQAGSGCAGDVDRHANQAASLPKREPGGSTSRT